MRDLIWALNPENTSLAGLAARIREYCSDYTEDLPLEINYQFDDDFPELRMDKDVHRNLMMIAKECLQNIVKHALATIVTIRFTFNEQQLMMQFSDNGKGFDTETSSGGNGLKNIRQRAASIQALCIIHAEQGRGTSVTIHLPTEKINTT
jgi:signal transduction histidine kinase